MQGVMPDKSLSISLEYEDANAQLTDLLSGIVPLPMISPAFKSVIKQQADQNVIFFPAKVKGPTIEIQYDYFYAHILNPVQAFDWEKSSYQAASKNADKVTQNWNEKEYNSHSDEVKWIRKRKKIVLDEDVIGNRHLFRVTFIEDLLFCNEHLAQSILKNGLTGISLIPVEDYTE